MQINFNDLNWTETIPTNIELDNDFKKIITNKASLTKALRAKYLDKLNLRLLRNEWQILQSHELFLNLSETPALVRDSIINTKDIPLVFARCCMPAASFSAKNKDLLTWKNKPIGDFIFSQKNYSRSNFKYSFINSKKIDRITRYNFNARELYLVRLSHIYINFMPMLIYEVFLQ